MVTTMDEHEYKEGEEFYEITFQIGKTDGTKKTTEIADYVLKCFPTAHNLTIIPCRIIKEPRRLVVSKDDYSYTKYNPKRSGQIIDD